MKYLKLFENVNSIKNFPSTIKIVAPIYMEDEEWLEDDGTDNHRGWQEEYLHSGQVFTLDSDTNLYSDKITYVGDSLDFPIEFTKENLMHLNIEGSIELHYDIPQDIKTFIEEHLIELLDSRKIVIEYQCKSVMSRIRLTVKIGTNFKWVSVEDAILNLHSVLKDEYALSGTFINNDIFRNDEFENAKKPINVNSIQFNINLINDWYK